MFDHLLRVAEEIRAGLQETLAGGVRRRLVQGAQLEVDSFWYRCAVVEQSGYWGLLPLLLPSYRFDPVQWSHFMATFRRLELDWSYRPQLWREHCERMGYLSEKGEEPEPIVIRVILRDPQEAYDLAPEGAPPATFTEAGGFAQAADIYLPRSYMGHPVVYETRPSAVATSFFSSLLDRLGSFAGWASDRQPSPETVSVGRSSPNTSGTAGGVLVNPRTGNSYLVSCAHVLGPSGTPVWSPGPVDGAAGRQVGVVRFSSISSFRPSGQVCALETEPDAGRVDLAVAELQTGVTVPSGRLDRVRAIGEMQRFQPVTFTGRRSGRVEAQLNTLTVWQELITPDFGDGPKGFRCFGGIFELAGREHDRSPIAAEGDSGAWITDEVNGVRSWVGMLIGKQGHRAYGCFATHILETLRRCPHFPDGLTLPN